jgi:hypothetical protein
VGDTDGAGAEQERLVQSVSEGMSVANFAIMVCNSPNHALCWATSAAEARTGLGALVDLLLHLLRPVVRSNSA